MARQENKKQTQEILDMVEEGLNVSKMANFLKTSLPNISRKLKRLERQNLIEKVNSYPALYRRKGGSLKSKPSKSIEFTDVSMHGLNYVNIPTHTAHKIKLSITYKGKQPLTGIIRPFGRYGTAKQSIYKISKRITIVAFKNKLNVWIHRPKGTRTREQIIQAKKEGYIALQSFGKVFNLVLEGNLAKVLQSHHVLENKAVNKQLQPLFKKYEKNIKEKIGSVVCKTSHKDKIEHEGNERVKAERIANGLEWLLLEYPEHFAMLAKAQGDYNENIKLHLTAIQEMRDTMKEIRNFIVNGNKRK